MNFDFLGSLGFAWVIAIWAAKFVVHTSFAMAVYFDAERLRKLQRRTIFVSSGIWVLAALIGGVVVAGIYWAIHHSALRPLELREHSDD